MAIELTVMSLDFDSDEPPRKLNFSNGQVVFGRGESSDVVLQGEEVSSEHAKLFFKDNKLMISDLGSVNGTLVDNIPLEANKEVEVKENQRILISGYLIKPKIVPGDEIEKEADSSSNQGVSSLEEETEDLDQEIGEFQDQDVFVDEPNDEMSFKKAQNGASEESSTQDDEVVVDPFSAPPAEAPPAKEINNNTEVHSSNLVESANIQQSKAESKEERPKSSISTQVAENEDFIEVNFDALKIFKVSGKVLNKGLGLSGVQVTLNENSPVFTNEDGFFEIPNIEEDSQVKISFLKTGYVLEPREVNLAISDDKLIEIEARKLITVRGKVANKGVPVSDALVSAKGIGETKTDTNGIYEFKEVVEGTKLDISVSKVGFKFVNK